jgi:hypothetical protein
VLITTNNKAEGSAPLSCAKLARAIADEFLRLKSETTPEDDAEEAPEEI